MLQCYTMTVKFDPIDEELDWLVQIERGVGLVPWDPRDANSSLFDNSLFSYQS